MTTRPEKLADALDREEKRAEHEASIARKLAAKKERTRTVVQDSSTLSQQVREMMRVSLSSDQFKSLKSRFWDLKSRAAAGLRRSDIKNSGTRRSGESRKSQGRRKSLAITMASMSLDSLFHKDGDVPLEQVVKAFNAVDEQGNGLLTIEEVAAALELCELVPSKAALQKIVDEIPSIYTDGMGIVRVQPEDFLSVIRELLQEEKELKADIKKDQRNCVKLYRALVLLHCAITGFLAYEYINIKMGYKSGSRLMNEDNLAAPLLLLVLLLPCSIFSAFFTPAVHGLYRDLQRRWSPSDDSETLRRSSVVEPRESQLYKGLKLLRDNTAFQKLVLRWKRWRRSTSGGTRQSRFAVLRRSSFGGIRRSSFGGIRRSSFWGDDDQPKKKRRTTTHRGRKDKSTKRFSQDDEAFGPASLEEPWPKQTTRKTRKSSKQKQEGPLTIGAGLQRKSRFSLTSNGLRTSGQQSSGYDPAMYSDAMERAQMTPTRIFVNPCNVPTRGMESASLAGLQTAVLEQQQQRQVIETQRRHEAALARWAIR
mmetsp:Transcript_53068/g.95135  ORF Transcript_53068/g.95135 Transcript_53068/m.95135 type:complete len:537 (+) Transcript_53068:136-1746(+)